MTVHGISSVTARIATIQSRFAPAQGFSAAMEMAQARQQSSTGATSSAPAPADASPFGTTPLAAQGASVASVAGGGNLAAKLPAAGKQWAGAIEAAARKHNIEPELLAAVVWQESGFKPNARSHAGAIGLAQLMPGTARGLGVDPHDPIQNLEGGARYLREQLDRFGSTELALAAYNAGPNRVARAGGIPRIAETQNYVTKVTDYYRQLR